MPSAHTRGRTELLLSTNKKILKYGSHPGHKLFPLLPLKEILKLKVKNKQTGNHFYSGGCRAFKF